jgi:Holliday junction DNA helicase RuvA
MIAYLRGPLAQLTPQEAIIDCAGVGYRAFISLNTYTALKDKAKDQAEAQLLTHLVVKEDAHLLYGFATADERQWFEQLIAISGVGGNTALAILSHLSPKQLHTALQREDVKVLQSVKGIGPKVAGRIVLELRNRLPKLDTPAADLPDGSDPAVYQTALTALVNLGFARAEVEPRLQALLKDGTTDGSVEALVRAVLRKGQ